MHSPNDAKDISLQDIWPDESMKTLSFFRFTDGTILPYDTEEVSWTSIKLHGVLYAVVMYKDGSIKLHELIIKNGFLGFKFELGKSVATGSIEIKTLGFCFEEDKRTENTYTVSLGEQTIYNIPDSMPHSSEWLAKRAVSIDIAFDALIRSSFTATNPDYITRLQRVVNGEIFLARK